MDESIREETFAQVLKIYEEWNEYRGEEIYNLDVEFPGCVNTETVYEEAREK